MTETLDWNGKLHVVNGSPLAKPYPLDRLFWIVTDEAEVVEVAYSAEASFWMPNGPWFCRQDGESGCWSASDILGWTDSQDDAEEAAELLAKLEGWTR